MKKISFVLMLACFGIFAACSSDDKDPVKPTDKDYAKEIAPRYVGDLTVVAPLEPGSEPETQITQNAVEVKYRSVNSIDLVLKDFNFLGAVPIEQIMLEDVKVEGNESEIKIVAKDFPNFPILGMEGVTIKVKGKNVVGDKIDLNLQIIVKGFTEPFSVDFIGEKSDKPVVSKQAQIVSIDLDSELIASKPTIENDNTEISVRLKKGVAQAELKDIPYTIEVSKGATVTPASGTKVDLSSGSLDIVVTAEDKKTVKTYTLKVVETQTSEFFFKFETWKSIPAKGGLVPNKEFIALDEITTWASSNDGLATAKSGVEVPPYPIRPTDDKKATQIETLLTQGALAPFNVALPAITAGSLFTGTFNAFSGAGNPLNATAFTGFDFTEKPKEVIVKYKYLPGAVFYRSSFEGRAKATPEAGTTDQCAINVILYDITEDSTTKITGNKPYDDPRIIAKAMFTGDRQESYKELTIPFIFSQEFDKDKKYRLSIITTSSAEGDTFSGAPGSKLFLDELEIITE